MIRGICVASPEELRRNIESAASRGLPRLAVACERTEPLAIVGGGHSAQDFPVDWPGHAMAINGAYDWLQDRRVPEWFLAIDPQEYVAGLLTRPQSATTFLLATCCPPSAFDALTGFSVMCFDSRQGDDPETPMDVPGGGTAMTRSPIVGALLGYRKFTLFGADSCYLDATTHVYCHEPPAHLIRVLCNGREWTTTLGLMGQAEYLAVLADILDITVVGDNLAAAMIAAGEWSYA